jgi:hypothetical protein
MEKIARYVANDGKEFECEEDCLRYEENNGVRKFENEIFLYYEDMAQASIQRVFEEQEWNCIYAIKVTSIEAAEFLKKAMDDYSNPFVKGYLPQPEIYCYDERHDTWTELSEELDKWNKFKRKIDADSIATLPNSMVKEDLLQLADRMNWEVEELPNGNYLIRYPKSDSEVFNIIMEQFM